MTEREKQPEHPAAEWIPREAWEGFLDRFDEFNADVPVRVQLVGQTETRLLAEHQPLLDVTLDDEAGVPVVLIECGDPAGLEGAGVRPEVLRHVLREPLALWTRRADPAGWDVLGIRGKEETVVISLGPHPPGPPPSGGAQAELFQAGSRARRAG